MTTVGFIAFKLLVTFVVFWLIFLISAMDDFSSYEWHRKYGEKLKKACWCSALGVTLSLILLIWSL